MEGDGASSLLSARRNAIIIFSVSCWSSVVVDVDGIAVVVVMVVVVVVVVVIVVGDGVDDGAIVVVIIG